MLDCHSDTTGVVAAHKDRPLNLYMIHYYNTSWYCWCCCTIMESPSLVVLLVTGIW